MPGPSKWLSSSSSSSSSFEGNFYQIIMYMCVQIQSQVKYNTTGIHLQLSYCVLCIIVHSFNINPLILYVITTHWSTFYIIHADWIFILAYRKSHYTIASIPCSPTTHQHCHFLYHNKNTQSPHRLWFSGTYRKVTWQFTVCVCVYFCILSLLCMV